MQFANTIDPFEHEGQFDQKLEIENTVTSGSNDMVFFGELNPRVQGVFRQVFLWKLGNTKESDH